MRKIVTPFWCLVNSCWLLSQANKSFNDDEDSSYHEERHEHPLPQSPQFLAISDTAFCCFELLDLICGKEEESKNKTGQASSTRAGYPHEAFDGSGKEVSPGREVQSSVCCSCQSDNSLETISVNINTPKEGQAREVGNIMCDIYRLADKGAER